MLPVSKSSEEWLGMGLTIIDTLDTAWIMNQLDIYEKCRQWVQKKFVIDSVHHRISVFETNIRVLGGFLSTYHLTNDKMFLEKAVMVGDRLLASFKGNFPTKYLDNDMEMTSLADVGTFGLEFKYLTFLTGDSRYWNASQMIYKTLFDQEFEYGLLPPHLDPTSMYFSGEP